MFEVNKCTLGGFKVAEVYLMSLMHVQGSKGVL
jgi:hypothetical protein